MDRQECPFLSIIIPVYNVERYLAECLESLKNQSFSDFEVILIDDGSPDKCGEICDRFAEHDQRFAVIHQINSGVCAARNNGLSRARGEWVLFVDSDDILPADTCQIYYDLAQETQADILWGYGQLLQDNKLIDNRIFAENFHITEKKKIDQFVRLMLDWKTSPVKRIGGNINVCWNRAMRRRMLIDNHILFNGDVGHMSEDMLFNLYVFYHAQSVAYVDRCVYRYRMVRESAANSLMKGGFQWNDALFAAVFAFIESTNYSDEEKDFVYRACNHLILERFRRVVDNYVFFADEKNVMKRRYAELKENLGKSVYQNAIRNIDFSTLGLSAKLYACALAVCSSPLIRIMNMLKGLIKS